MCLNDTKVGKNILLQKEQILFNNYLINPIPFLFNSKYLFLSNR